MSLFSLPFHRRQHPLRYFSTEILIFRLALMPRFAVRDPDRASSNEYECQNARNAPKRCASRASVNSALSTHRKHFFCPLLSSSHSSLKERSTIIARERGGGGDRLISTVIARRPYCEADSLPLSLSLSLPRLSSDHLTSPVDIFFSRRGAALRQLRNNPS